MDLLSYLNSNFLASTDGIIEHFINTFGVNVKTVNNMFLFKYDQIAVKWGDISFGSRGHILSKDSNGWYYVSRPADKFFNLHEGHCPLFNEDTFKSRLSSIVAFNKIDGTCIQVYYHNNEWYASTLGTIITLAVGTTNLTFSDLFWKTIDKLKFNELDKNHTYVFELCSPYNRIVTDYGSNIFSKLLYIRNNKTGEYASESHITSVSAFLGVSRPEMFSLITVRDFFSLSLLVERMENDETLGKNPEGIVLYDNGVPVAKVKSKRYLALSRFSGANSLCSRNALVELFMSGNIDDVYGDLSSDMQKFCDDMGEYARSQIKEAFALVKEVIEKKPETQKDYALIVKSSKFSSLFFKNKDKILAGEFKESDFLDSLKIYPPKDFINELYKLWGVAEKLTE